MQSFFVVNYRRHIRNPSALRRGESSRNEFASIRRGTEDDLVMFGQPGLGRFGNGCPAGRRADAFTRSRHHRRNLSEPNDISYFVSLRER
jgi:hypothetical protein